MSEISPALTEKEIETALMDEKSEISRQIESLMCSYADAMASGADPYQLLLINEKDPPITKVAKRILAGAA